MLNQSDLETTYHRNGPAYLMQYLWKITLLYQACDQFHRVLEQRHNFSTSKFFFKIYFKEVSLAFHWDLKETNHRVTVLPELSPSSIHSHLVDEPWSQLFPWAPPHQMKACLDGTCYSSLISPSSTLKKYAKYPPLLPQNTSMISREKNTLFWAW